MTFRVCAEQHRKAAPHSTATADKVRRTLERHAYPTFGDLPVSTIRPSMVQAWVIGLPLAPATAKVVLGYVSQVFRAAVRDRIVTSNPRDGVQLPGARSKQVEIPELATVEAVRAALPARFRAVVELVVFTTAAGGPVTRSQWSQIWRSAARAGAVPEREGLHTLRHFYASALIRHGELAKTVQRRLGHSSAAVTLDTYTHLWPDSDDRTREAVAAALGSVRGDSVATQ